MGRRQISVQPTAAPFLVKLINDHYEKRQRTLLDVEAEPLTPLIEPEVAFRAAPAKGSTPPGLYWLAEVPHGGMPSIIAALIRFLPPPSYAAAQVL